jgi:hypothetical protein
MELQPIDLVVSFFFLSALVLVARSRKRLTSEGMESYRYISSGLVILTLMVVSRLYSTIGAFHPIPLLNDPVFYRLIFWIGIITGLTMLVSGISNWLPLSRIHRKLDREKLQRLDFVKRVEQLVGVERRSPVILSKALQYMVEHFGFRGGAVYVYSRRQQKPVFLSSSGSTWLSDTDLEKISFDANLADDPSNKDSSGGNGIVTEVPSGITRPDLTLPVVAGGKLSALFLLWLNRMSSLDDDDRMNLKIAADIIGNKVELRMLQLGESFHGRQVEWLKSFVAAVDRKKPVKENVSEIAKWFTGMIPVELISFTVIYDEKNMQRFSVGEDGTLLSEKRVDMLSHHAFLKHVLDNEAPLVVNDTGGKTSVPIDKMILVSGMKSLTAFRLGYGQRPGGALVVASKETNRFSSREIELIEAAVPLLGHLVSEEIYRYKIGVGERRVDLTNSFLADCGRASSMQDLFEQAAAILSRELRTSMVRVSTYEYDGAFLKSRALASMRPIEGLTPVDGHMILSLMPYHTLVRESGRLMMINQEQKRTERKITEAEAKQICHPDIQSALLVPITVGRETLAVISLAELRRWSRYRYNQSDVLFASSVAAGLSLAIQLALGKRTKVPSRLEESSIEPATFPDPVLKGRIKSSLSSILGSVEMIKSHNPNADAGLERYLSIIDRSAQRINDYCAEKVSP